MNKEFNIKILKNKISHGRVRVYTYQDSNTLLYLKNDGFISGKEKYSHFYEHFREQYNWMFGEYSKRTKQELSEFPIWFYLKRMNNRKYVEKNSVRIVAEIPIHRILLSNMSHWENILNNYPPLFDNECEYYESLSSEEQNIYYKKIRERIFDLESYDNKIGYRWQGIVDKIYDSEIISIRKY